jgi:hypothetical protein
MPETLFLMSDTAVPNANAFLLSEPALRPHRTAQPKITYLLVPSVTFTVPTTVAVPDAVDISMPIMLLCTRLLRVYRKAPCLHELSTWLLQLLVVYGNSQCHLSVSLHFIWSVAPSQLDLSLMKEDFTCCVSPVGTAVSLCPVESVLILLPNKKAQTC